jgi:colanic acid biosynthesis glycosyl transferase WcaI
MQTPISGDDQIVLVSQVFYPDVQATSQLLSDLMPKLGERGAKVEVLCGYPLSEGSSHASSSNERWKGITIRRGGLRGNYKRSIARRIAAYAMYSSWLLTRLLFRGKGTIVIIGTTNPPFAPVLVYLCARLRRWRYKLILHDIYPEGLIALGCIRKSGIVATGWKMLNRRAYVAAEQIFVLGRDMRELCIRDYSVEPARVTVTPSWCPVDFNQVTEASRTRLWKRLGLKADFVVQYSGNMGLWHDIDAIIMAANLLRYECKIQFLLIGDGIRRSSAEKLCATLELANVQWLDLQPIEELEDTLCCCHAALVSQSKGLEGIAVPSKLYGILASGRAVIAQVPVNSEAALVVRESNCGIVVEPGDVNALAQAILRLSTNRAAMLEMGRASRKAYDIHYSVQAAVGAFTEETKMTPQKRAAICP